MGLFQLKNMLRHNKQPTIGTKKMLINRIIDCKTNGCLPICNKCKHCLLIMRDNCWICPGYIDDNGVFIGCNNVLMGPQRVQWIDI